MAAESQGESTFNYGSFKLKLEEEKFTKVQGGPLGLRLQILESFMDLSIPRRKRPVADLFHAPAETLTIVDLTDPFMDPASACTLFNVSLGLFLDRASNAGLVIALDEAHKVSYPQPWLILHHVLWPRLIIILEVHAKVRRRG